MELQKAIEILEHHQQWRLGKIDDMKWKPRELTDALDLVLEQVKKFDLANVGGSLPTDEEISDAAKKYKACGGSLKQSKEVHFIVGIRAVIFKIKGINTYWFPRQ